MLARLQSLIVHTSASGWLYLAVAVLFVGALAGLQAIGTAFSAHAGGALPFDLQNGLRPAEVYGQLAGYSARARQLYGWFALLDFAFPFFAGLFVAATVTFLLRRNLPRWYAWLTGRHLLPVFFLATACDWLENLVALTLIGLYPAEVSWLPAVLVAVKRLKLAFTAASQGVMILLLVYGAWRWLTGWLRAMRRTRHA